MYEYLRKKKIISNNEIEIILKIININYIHIAIKALLKIGLNNEHPQFESILKLILKHIINNNVVRRICIYNIYFIFYILFSIKMYLLL